MKEQIQTNRLKEIDIYKTIAIVMVVCGHVASNTVGVFSGFISFVHMPIFYFVSGFFLYKELKKYSEKELVKKKFFRLVIPYIVWSCVAFSANAVVLIAGKGMDIGALLDDAVQVFIYARSVWFFIQLFFAHMLFILIHKVVDKKALRVVINLVVWALLIVFCTTTIFCMWKIKWLYGFLLLGYICSEYDVLSKIGEVKQVKRGVIFFFCLVGWIAATVLSSGVYSTDLVYGFDDMPFSLNTLGIELSVLACGLTGMATIYFVSCVIAKFRFFDILYRMGSYTLDIYVGHMLLLFVIKKIPMPKDLVFVLSFIIAFFFICVPLYILAKYFLRKIKLYRMVT